nr:class I SAM-dependent methyltransferase [Vallitaleaceae bacterium]
MHKNPMKFENPIRITELDPINTLKKIGIKSTDVVCDYGAGTGVFTIPAASLTKNKVYAVDIDENMLSIVKRKIADQNIENIIPIKVEDYDTGIETETVDLYLHVTVLHEMEDIEQFMIEVRRILKKDGHVMVIEFHKKETSYGPPVGERMSGYQAARHFLHANILYDSQYELGENYYMLLLNN